MGRVLTTIGNVGLGAGLMYLLDPRLGSRRRALLRDKLASLANHTTDAIDTISCDLGHRLHGWAARAREQLYPAPTTDEVLVERVRAHIGRDISHPGAIFVTAENGTVTLGGPILASEVDRLLDQVRTVPGVRDVVNRLEVHDQPGDVPGLQGYAHREARFELLQTNWSPTARFFVGAAGAGLAIYGARRGGLAGGLTGLVGLGLFGRALTNLPFRRLIGVGAGRQAVFIEKDINIAAPVDRVFAFCAHPESFPLFMGHVREVRKTAPERYRWTVSGPAGVPISWEAEVTRLIPNQLLAWKTLPGSIVGHEGTVRFDSNPDGSTRLDVKLYYAPPAGAFGHVLAALLGSDPKRQMDDDLVRFKSLLEEGRTTAHGRTVTLEAVAAEVERESRASPAERRAA